jgi:rhomboid protease GluP
MSENRPTSDAHPMVQVGVYGKLADARAASLALAAKDIPYSIDRAGDEWLLRVEAPFAGIGRTELESVAAEEQHAEETAQPPPMVKGGAVPLFVALWILSSCFFAQQMLGDTWTERGLAISKRIVGNGEWWRTITALTLHGDLPHLVANLGTGLLFAAFLQPILGIGWTWFVIVLSGIAGNSINAWAYRDAAHASLGASTAVFGALGILVGLELWARWSHPRHRSLWTLMVPLGAGLALFAYLGVGDEHSRIDIMAHLFGMAAGLPLGVVAGATRLREITSAPVQAIAGVIALLLPVLAWSFAMGVR